MPIIYLFPVLLLSEIESCICSLNKITLENAATKDRYIGMTVPLKLA